MRENRTSGSVEGVMGNHDPYSDPPFGSPAASLRASTPAQTPLGMTPCGRAVHHVLLLSTASVTNFLAAKGAACTYSSL